MTQYNIVFAVEAELRGAVRRVGVRGALGGGRGQHRAAARG